MTTTKELETVVVREVKLDIYFTYDSYFGFELHSIEDITGGQDLTPILSEWTIELVEKELRKLYQSRGWL